MGASSESGDHAAALPARGARASLAYEWLDAAPGATATTTREPGALVGDFDAADAGCRISAAAGSGNVTVNLNVSDRTSARYAPASRFLFVAVWVDWNQDGDWTNPTVDANELIAVEPTRPPLWPADVAPNSHEINLPFTIPAGTPPGETWMRCRLVVGNSAVAGGIGGAAYLVGNSGDQGLLALADSPDNGGEVEDHCIVLVDSNGGTEADTANNTVCQVLGGGGGGGDDSDGDGADDSGDNCPMDPNPGQEVVERVEPTSGFEPLTC